MNFLFKQIDIASLVFFRVCFGILAFADVLALLTYFNWYTDAYNPAKFHFTYYGFEWVQPLPEPFMSLFLISLLVASIFITLGHHYKISTSYFALGFTYMFLVEKANYLNHGYLFCVLSFMMILLPAHRAYSWDVLDKPSLRTKTIPYYPIFLLKFAMGIVYFMGGIAKLNPDWLNAMPLKLWLKQKKDYFIIGPILEQEWTAWFMSYGGVCLDLCIVPLLVLKKTRWFGFFALVFFHITNTLVFQIGIFPWLSICLSLLYFSADFPRQVGNWLIKRFPPVQKIELWWENLELKRGIQDHVHPLLFSESKKKIISGLIGLFCLLNILIPLRHHTFEGDVAWTEEGHRYSWRMMLRSKRGSGHFEAKNLRTGKRERIKHKEQLSDRQKPKLFTHPDMILQFAHHLRDQYQEKWATDSVAIYAHIRCKLNGGKYQPYVDSKVDLAKEEWSFLKESDWIVPLKK